MAVTRSLQLCQVTSNSLKVTGSVDVRRVEKGPSCRGDGGGDAESVEAMVSQSHPRWVPMLGYWMPPMEHAMTISNACESVIYDIMMIFDVFEAYLKSQGISDHFVKGSFSKGPMLETGSCLPSVLPSKWLDLSVTWSPEYKRAPATDMTCKFNT